MKLEETRNIDYELALIHAQNSAIVNPLFCTLLRSSDPLIRFGAIKALFLIVRHHLETGKMLGGAEKTNSSAKIQIISSSASNTPKIDVEHALLIQDLAVQVLPLLMPELQNKQASIGSIIISDTLLLFSHALSQILLDETIMINLESDKRGKVEEDQEVLLQHVKLIAHQILSQLLSWFQNKRPLYAMVLSYTIGTMQSPSFDQELDLCATFFPDLFELPVVDCHPDKLPLGRYLRALEATSWADGTDHFGKLAKFALLISKPSSAVQLCLFDSYREAIIVQMASILELQDNRPIITSLAVEIMNLVKIGKFNLDGWFLTKVLGVREWKSVSDMPSNLLKFYLGLDREKEVRTQLLNKFLQGWTKAAPPDAPRLNANCRLLLLFILRNPGANHIIYSALSAYVQKNASIDKIQKLVDDSVADN